MRYGLTIEGERWHIARPDGAALCGGFALHGHVDARPERVCGNCDAALRVKGKRAKQAARTRAPRQVVYVPRHKFEDA